jgi:hypothetical protein
MFVDHSKSLTEEMDSFWASEAARIRAKPARTKRGSPERSVQVSLKRYLEQVLPGCIVAAVKNEHQARSDDKLAVARFHAKRKAEGVRAGFPDMVIVLPAGRTFYIEVKAPKGVLSDAQRELHGRMREMGHLVLVAKSIDALRDGLRAAGIATRDAA